MTLDDLLIDKRIVRRNIEKGRLDVTTYQGLLDQLPDRSGNVWRPDASGSAERAQAPAPAPTAPAPTPAAAPADERSGAVDANAAPLVVPSSPMAPG
jgi:hypothetical protein